MEIVLHGGLHKSGTTTVQSAWWRAFERDHQTLYPRLPTPSPAHHQVYWSLSNGASRASPQAVEDSVTDPLSARGLAPVMLTELISEAEDRGYRRLLLSSETFAHISMDTAEVLRSTISGHHFVLLLTVTAPIHRFYSHWQQLVKSGLSLDPRSGSKATSASALLEPGRLEHLVRSMAADRTVVRLVRTSPPEDDLAASLLDALSIPMPSAPLEVEPLNATIGEGVEILRRLNAAGRTLGLMTRESRATFEQIVAETEWEPRTSGRTTDYDPPACLVDVAAQERDFLMAKRPDIDVVDPWRLLDGWTNGAPPAWAEKLALNQPAGIEMPSQSDELGTVRLQRQELALLRDRRSHLQRQLQRSERQLQRSERRVSHLERAAAGRAEAAPSGGIIARARLRVRSAARLLARGFR